MDEGRPDTTVAGSSGTTSVPTTNHHAEEGLTQTASPTATATAMLRPTAPPRHRFPTRWAGSACKPTGRLTEIGSDTWLDSNSTVLMSSRHWPPGSTSWLSLAVVKTLMRTNGFQSRFAQPLSGQP